MAFRLSLALNLVFCSLGIFRVCLIHLSATAAAAEDDDNEDEHSDVVDDVITQLSGHMTPDASTTSEYLVPNIVHYIWYTLRSLLN